MRKVGKDDMVNAESKQKDLLDENIRRVYIYYFKNTV